MRARKSKTYREPTPLGTMFVTIADEDGEPAEVFVNAGKRGTDVQALAEGIGRLCSLVLSGKVPPHKAGRARAIAKQLKGIGGPRESSLPDTLGKILEEHIESR